MPEWSLPRPRPGAGPAQPGQDRPRPGREACSQSLPAARAAGRVVGHGSRRSATRSSGRSAYVELYGAYAECEAIYGVDHLLALRRHAGRRPTGAPSASTRGSIDWARLHHRGPPAVGGRARPGARPRRARRGPSRGRAAAAPGAVARPPHRRVRPREHAHRVATSWSSYSWLATRRLDRDERVRFVAADAGGGARRCWRSTARTAATSCASSTAATRTRRSTQLDEDAVELLRAADPDQVLPGRHPPGARAPARSATARVLITGALDFVVEPLAPAVRRDRRAPR